MRDLARRFVLVLAVASLIAACSKGGGDAGTAAGGSGGGAGGKFTGPEYVMGNSKAKVTVVEYASTTCSHCARFDAEVFPQIKAKYIDTGKIRYVFREFLTSPEQVAAAGFLVARCAGPSKYFNVVEGLFRSQPMLFQTQDPSAWIGNAAKSAGLNDQQVDACVKDETALKALQERFSRAVRDAHIEGTPAILVDGKPIGNGEVPIAELDKVIQPLLK